MSIQLENTSALGRKFTIDVPIKDINVEIEKRVAEYAKTMRMDGFRKGKIPSKVIQQRYGNAIFGEVIEKMIDDSYNNGIKENQLEPVSRPRIENLRASPHEDLHYEAYFDIHPDIDIKAVDKISIEKKIPVISEKDIDNTIDRLRQQQSNWNAVDRPAKQGDKLFLDVKADVEGASIKDMHKLPCELGAKTMIPGFEDGLIGAKVNDQVTLNLTFPNPYFDPNVAGKPVTFTIQVLEILESQLPTDDLLMNKLAVDNIDELRIKIREHIEREAKEIVKNNLKSEVIDQLLKTYHFELPESLIEQELHYMIHPEQSQNDHHHHDATPEQMEQAKSRVKTGLFMRAFIKAHELTPDTERMIAKVKEMSSVFNDPSEITQRYLQDKNFIKHLQNITLEDQVIDEILKIAKTSEQEVTYDEIFK